MKFHVLLESFWRGQSLVFSAFSEITFSKTSLFFAPQGQFISRLVWTEDGAGMGKALREVCTLVCNVLLLGVSLLSNKQLHTELLRLHWIWMNYKIIKCLILLVFPRCWRTSQTKAGTVGNIQKNDILCTVSLIQRIKMSDNLCLDFFWFKICILRLLHHFKLQFYMTEIPV